MSKFNLPAISRNVFLALAVVTSATATGFAEEAKEKVVARVNGVEVTERELALAEVDMLQQFAQTPAEERRAAILNALLDIKSLAHAAEESGLADDANFRARMAFNRSRQLHNLYFQKNALHIITDEQLKTRYDIEIANFPEEEEVRAAHILVGSEEEANAIIVELDDGADFNALAKAKSTGPSGPNGGDLGFFGRGQMVPEFENAAFGLEDGAHTKEPVKSQFGFHVIKREETRTKPAPDFEEVKEQLRQALARENYFKLTQSAREKYKPEILDEELKTKIEALKSPE